MTADSSASDARPVARAVLIADGAGCLAAAAALAAAPAASDRLAPLIGARGPLLAALALTGASLLASARKADAGALSRCAAVNATWAAGCALAVRGRHTPTSRTLVRITGVADLAMAIVQGALAAPRRR